MSIEIKKSEKPVIYEDAKKLMEERLLNVDINKSNELIWTLEHPDIYTAGTSYSESDILDKSINIIRTSRGGKITWHGPGQLICYLAINLSKRKKDIRNFVKTLENSIIKSLREYGIESYNDRKNIGIWVNINEKREKVAAIGIKVKKWIAYHGFSINVSNNLDAYKKIIPCGIKDKEVTNLIRIKKQKYNSISDLLIKKFLKEIKN